MSYADEYERRKLAAEKAEAGQLGNEYLEQMRAAVATCLRKSEANTVHLTAPGPSADLQTALTNTADAAYSVQIADPASAWAILSREGELTHFDEAACRECADYGSWDGRVYAMAVSAILDAERARILAKLQAIKPSEQPYTRKVWNDELRGEMRMWERMVKALEGGE